MFKKWELLTEMDKLDAKLGAIEKLHFETRALSNSNFRLLKELHEKVLLLERYLEVEHKSEPENAKEYPKYVPKN